MINVLINAYACSPNMGSEPGMAWNWITNLAKYCKVYVITEGEFRDEIELELSTLPQGVNMRFYYNPVSDKIRTMCWNQGDWRFYLHYKKWQKSILPLATEIIKTNNINIIHHLNMIGFREPGYLWSIRGVPFVWGPVGGMENMPTKYLNNASLKINIFLRVKNIINDLQLRFHPRVRKAIYGSELIISAVNGVQQKLIDVWAKKSVVINETGCHVDKSFSKLYNQENKIDILWVGKFDFRKQLNIALDSMNYLEINQNINLHIVGEGSEIENSYYKNYARKLNLSNITWHGKITNSDVQKLMKKSDVFFFTSIMEATSTVVLEAIQNKLPVICFDTCGFGSVVDESIGYKIKLSDPKKSSKQFADIINNLNKKELKILSDNCDAKLKLLSWENKAELVTQYYKKILKGEKIF
jgi:glycosyltransferase involved in cell wall biosynthesis